MSNSISVDVFTHLVGLAALELSPDQAEYLREQLNKQLKVIDQLRAIPVEQEVPINLHGVPYAAAESAAPRKDEWLPFSNPAKIMEQAPRVEDGYIIVPDIPHTKLE